MSDFYKWNGGTTQRDGLMLRPGQVFDAGKYPALDIESELDSGRVTVADGSDELTFVSPEEIASQKATLANRKALADAAEKHQASISVLEAALKAGEVGSSEEEKKLKEGFEVLTKERALLESEKAAFELEKKAHSKKNRKGGSK